MYIATSLFYFNRSTLSSTESVEIELSHNLLNCDHQIAWMKMPPVDWEITTTDAPCATPAQWVNTYWNVLTYEDLCKHITIYFE